MDDEHHRRAAIARLVVIPTDEALREEPVTELIKRCQIALNNA